MRHRLSAAPKLLGIAAVLVMVTAAAAAQEVAPTAAQPAAPAKSVKTHKPVKAARAARRKAPETAAKAPAGTTIPMDLTDMNRGVSGYGDPRTRPDAGGADAPDGVRPTLGNGLTPGAAFAF